MGSASILEIKREHLLGDLLHGLGQAQFYTGPIAKALAPSLAPHFLRQQHVIFQQNGRIADLRCAANE